MADSEPRFRRVLLKISGEGFCPPGEFGIHAEQLSRINWVVWGKNENNGSTEWTEQGAE